MSIDYEAIWDKITHTTGSFTEGFAKSITRVFGSSNERKIRQMSQLVDRVNSLSSKFRDLSEQQLVQATEDFRKRLREGEELDDVLPEAFAACREASHRTLGKGRWVDGPNGEKIPLMAHFDVQLMGGVVLHNGGIAEMMTGEGKTLVATLPAYLNALEGNGVHVVTVNDYLARRDAEWMAPVYQTLGLSVGFIQSNMDNDLRQKAYACNITYGTNNEFGFDYLRDNMKPARQDDPRFHKSQQQVQGIRNYAIIDEVDNILIDEARTPLIISGPAHDDTTKYVTADRIARQLRKDLHFEVKEKEHTCHLTDDGVREAERLMDVESFYTPGNMHWPHLIDQSLKAHNLYRRDKEYVVMNGEVVIVDEFTGRLMPGRHWSDGLHQAVEAKEGVRIKEESQTLATVTLQNFFKTYKKLSGMTGTAMTEASEFWKIYKLDVVSIPTNRPLQRVNSPDVIFRTEKEKYKAIVDDIERAHKYDVVELRKPDADGENEVMGTISDQNDDVVVIRPANDKAARRINRSEITNISGGGRPILVGTVSIEKSETISGMLKRRGIAHKVLNAKFHESEAEIVAQAGRKGALTISTNMAGRGTDIILGGNPEFIAWSELKSTYESRLDVPPEIWKETVDRIEKQEKMDQERREVVGLGGLHIIGTERHEARRIDNQLRGRAGRQGDPGSSRFFLSLEDDLMRIFAGEWVKNVLTRFGMQEGEAIESRLVSRRIEGAQKKVEERNFDIRKNLLEYDEVMDEQRKRVYSFRQNILDGARCKHLILEMIDEQVDSAVTRFTDPTYGVECFAQWVSQRLGAELDANEFTGAEFETAVDVARNNAVEQAASLITDQIEENLGEEVDSREWNWQAICAWANTRWGLKLKDRELKKIGRDQLYDFLMEHAQEAILNVDLDAAKTFLDERWGLRSLSDWANHKFAIEIAFEDLGPDSLGELSGRLKDHARAIYSEKETTFPVSVGIALFMPESGQRGGERYDRESLVKWANDRFETNLNIDEHRSKFRSDFAVLLTEKSREFFPQPSQLKEAEDLVEKSFGDESGADSDQLETLANRLERLFGGKLDTSRISSKAHALNQAYELFDDKYRQEMRQMERMLLLQILDASWKDHLYAMDHLRNAIGLRGYAQVDPKVEYKREGMRFFDAMWESVGDKVTDLVFRMEQAADPRMLASTWQTDQMEAIHDDASGSGIRSQQEAAIEASKRTEQKKEPIRNQGQRVGRNTLCPCGSGKKYKQCCMRRAG